MRQITIKSYETKQSPVAPIIFLIIGILLLVNPGEFTEFISYIFGGIFLCLGIGKFILDLKRSDHTTGDSFYSITMIILGIIFIFFSGTVEFIIRLLVGIWVIINGINAIAVGTNLVYIDKRNVLSLIIGFLLVLIGLYTICVSNLVLSTLGLVIIIYAVLELINYFYLLFKNR